MGASEIVIIFFIYLLLFGAKGIPSLAKTMGKAMYQFREARNDIQKEIMSSAKDIQNSAKEVRAEVEKAASLAQEQAKSAQDTLNNSVQFDPTAVTIPTEPPKAEEEENLAENSESEGNTNSEDEKTNPDKT